MSRNRIVRIRRRAAIIQEAVMAVVITTTVLMGVTQTLARLAQQRRVVEQRTAARYLAANVMEDAMSRPWSQLTTDEMSRAATSLSKATPPSELRMTPQVADETDSVKRITVQIDWTGSRAGTARPWRLVAWRQKPREARP